MRTMNADRHMSPRQRKPAAGSARRRGGMGRRLRQRVRAGVLVVGLGSALGLGGWAMMTGRVGDAVDWSLNGALELTAMAGFSVQEVVVLGRGVTDRDALWTALQVERGDPIFGFDAGAARARLLDLPWIHEASIERRLPDQLYLTIDERRPLAIWQRDGVQRLIDADGMELTRQEIGRWSHLPLVVGEGAERAAAAFLAEVDSNPAVAEAMTAAIRVGDRRWDLMLGPDVRVHLPEQDAHAALNRLEGLIVRDAILERRVAAIDLRITDRLVIRLPAPVSHDAPTHEENT